MCDTSGSDFRSALSRQQQEEQFPAFLRQLLLKHYVDLGEINLSCSPGLEDFGSISCDTLTQAFSYVARNNGTDNEENFRINLPHDIDNLPRYNEAARLLIQRIYFSSFSFHSLPENIVGQTYSNIRHIDIRDNNTLQDIGSIIRQLPDLQSFNICDCPNLKSLLPLATVPIQTRRKLALKHIWIRGCNLTNTTKAEWEGIFKSLAMSTGPVERLALSRNQMSYLPCSIANLSPYVTYLFVEDMPGIVIPDVIGSMMSLRYLSLAGNDLSALPSTIGRLGDDVQVNFHRNPNLIYPPAPHHESMIGIRTFLHAERMRLFRGIVRMYPHLRRARVRANERIFQPGGSGFVACKSRFELSQLTVGR